MGLFFPFFYALLPEPLGNICLCKFFVKKNDGKHYPALTMDSFNSLSALNTTSLLLVNFTFMGALIVMVNTIRHINDDTKIKMECSVIVGWFILLNILQFTLFTMLQASRCHRTDLLIS
jgi:hypothetical protein